MGSMSKRKGALYERKTCQRLSLWVSDMTREDVFWRSAMSGGRATRGAKSRYDTRRALRRDSFADTQVGDISAIHKLGHLLVELFIVECKFHKDLQMHLPVWGESGQLNRVWRPTRKLSAERGREPMVIAKQNRKNDLVLTSHEGERILAHGRLRQDAFQPTVYFHREDMAVYMLSDMLTDVSFAAIRAAFGKSKPRKTLQRRG